MKYPFIKKEPGSFEVKLHKQLYRKPLINKLKNNLAGEVTSFKTKGDYYFLRIDAESESDCLNFLNYLIYLQRKQENEN